MDPSATIAESGVKATADVLPARSSVAGTPARDGSSAAGRLDVPRLDGYQISERLGCGGMGPVWRAWQFSTRREVALKLLNFAGVHSERSRMRFDREVEVTSRLQHPN